MFAHLSSCPDLNNRLNLFIALGPALYEGHCTSPLMRTLKDLHVDWIFDIGKWSSFMNQSPFYTDVAEVL